MPPRFISPPRPAIYKRDSTGRTPESAIYKRDTRLNWLNHPTANQWALTMRIPSSVTPAPRPHAKSRARQPQARTTPSRARASIVGMDSLAPLAHRMPYTAAFPKALGTGLLISTPRPITAELRGEMERFIDEYEHALSRFRADSLVAHIGNAEHGGHFDFPDWAGPLFDLYDALHAATRGAIDPCVGEDLIRLGYDPALSFTVEADAGERLGALHGRAVWGRDVVRSSGTTLVTRSPVHVDFGACGKGYLVDSLGGLLTDSELSRTSHVKSAETTNPTCQSSISDSKRESAARNL